MQTLVPRSALSEMTRWAAPLMGVFTVGWLAAPAYADNDPLPGPGGAAVVAAEVEQDGVSLRLYPNQIGIDRSRSFNDKGNTQQSRNRMSMYFQAVVTSERKVLAYRDRGVDRLRDGWDRELTLPDPSRRAKAGWTLVQANRRGGGDDAKVQFSFGFNTEAPGKDVRVLSEVGGQIELLVSEGELRAIRLTPLGDFLGKRLRVRDMNDLRLRVRRADDGGKRGVQLSMPTDRMPQIREVRFFAADGQALPGGDSSGQRRQGNLETRTYRGTPPDTATMEIQVYPGVKTMEMSWTVRDVPLPASEDAGPVEELALDTQPLGGGPKLPGLEVEIDQ